MSSDNSLAVTPDELQRVMEEVKQHYRDPKSAARNEFSDNEDIGTIQMLTRSYSESATAALETCVKGHTEKFSPIGSKLEFFMKHISSRIDVAKENAELAEDAKTCQENWNSVLEDAEQTLKTVQDIHGLGRILDRANQLTESVITENSKWERNSGPAPVKLREQVGDMSQAYSQVIRQFNKVERLLGDLHEAHELRTKLATWDSYRDTVSKLGSDVVSQLPKGWDNTLSVVNST